MIGSMLGRDWGGVEGERLQELFELQYVGGGSCGAFECSGPVSNCTHTFVCWGERGISDWLVLEGDDVTLPFAFSGFDVTFVSVIMLRRSAKVSTDN